MATQQDVVKYLEDQYSPSRWSKLVGPEEIIKQHCEKTMKASKHARSMTKNELDVRYGNMDGQQMDIFYPNDSEITDKVLVFIHGGYWQEMRKEYYDYLGEIFSSFGIVVAIVGYDLAPKVKMGTIYKEIQESIVYLYKKFPNSKIFVSGHSAGGHLASLLLKEDWSEYGLPKFVIQGVIAVSGVYDLQPLVHTYVNDALNMDEEEARLFSPIHYIEEVRKNSDCKVLCLIGEYESDEFHRQSKDYCKALQSSGISADLHIIKDTDHFSVMHDFLNDGYDGIDLFLNLINADTSNGFSNGNSSTH